MQRCNFLHATSNLQQKLSMYYVLFIWCCTHETSIARSHTTCRSLADSDESPQQVTRRENNKTHVFQYIEQFGTLFRLF